MEGEACFVALVILCSFHTGVLASGIWEGPERAARPRTEGIVQQAGQNQPGEPCRYHCQEVQQCTQVLEGMGCGLWHGGHSSKEFEFVLYCSIWPLTPNLEQQWKRHAMPSHWFIPQQVLHLHFLPVYLSNKGGVAKIFG